MIYSIKFIDNTIADRAGFLHNPQAADTTLICLCKQAVVCASHNIVFAPQDVKNLAYAFWRNILAVVLVRVLCGRRNFMELLRLLTAFDYALMLILAAIFVFSVMEGGHKKH